MSEWREQAECLGLEDLVFDYEWAVTNGEPMCDLCPAKLECDRDAHEDLARGEFVLGLRAGKWYSRRGAKISVSTLSKTERRKTPIPTGLCLWCGVKVETKEGKGRPKLYCTRYHAQLYREAN